MLRKLDSSLPSDEFSLFKVGSSITVAALALLSGVSAVSAQTIDMGKLPWQGGVKGTISTTRNPMWHSDAWMGMSHGLDIAIPAGTKVRAPINSKVTGICIADAKTGHAAMKLQSTGLKSNFSYSLIHVKVDTKSVKKNTTFLQGQEIGVVAGDLPKNDCARSFGVHLHFGLPSKDVKIDGYSFGSKSPKPGASLTSNNSR